MNIQADSAASASQWSGVLEREKRSGNLRVVSVLRDPMLLGRTIERAQQFHRGVPIWGAEIVSDSDGGSPVSIFGSLASDSDLSVEPSLSTTAAAEALRAAADGTDAVLTAPASLVLARSLAGDLRLAFTSIVSSAGGRDRIFVDAHSGETLLRFSDIMHQAAIGSGRGVLGDTKKISTTIQGGSFVASDSHRPPALLTFDLRNDLQRLKNLMDGRVSLALADLATDADNIWNDAAVVDAHAHIGWTYDYFFKRFGRRGLDDRDRPILVATNALTSQSYPFVSPADRNFAVNAFWCDTCGSNQAGLIYLGNGLPAGFTSGNRTYLPFAGALDITAHELTHGVTSSTSRLPGIWEYGALNESFSDMMGKSVEFFYRAPGGNPGQADYTLGKDIARGVGGTLSGNRSMSNPAAFGHPDHYARYQHSPFTSAGDAGGIHANAGIPNQAFYLSIHGGLNPTSGATVQGAGSTSREQIEKAFYRAFAFLMPPSATFMTARAATIRAARDLYGVGSVAERSITQAWTAVGVPDLTSVRITSPGPVTQNRFVSLVTRLNASGIYQANLTGFDPAFTDADIYLATTTSCPYWLRPMPSCVISYSNSPDAFETATAVVRSGQQIVVFVENFRGRTVAPVLTDFVSFLNGISPSTTFSEAPGASLKPSSTAWEIGPPRPQSLAEKQ